MVAKGTNVCQTYQKIETISRWYPNGTTWYQSYLFGAKTIKMLPNISKNTNNMKMVQKGRIVGKMYQKIETTSRWYPWGYHFDIVAIFFICLLPKAAEGYQT